jgi:hypothetical protein
MSAYTPEEIENAKRIAGEADAHSREEVNKSAKILNEVNASGQNYVNRSGKALSDLGLAFVKQAQTSADGKEGLTAYSDFTTTLSNSTGALLNGPGFGKLGESLELMAQTVGKTVVAIQQSGEAQFKAYQDLSSSGLSIGMTETFSNLHSAGYTMPEMAKFTSIMKQNSTIFSALSGSASDGAKQFVDVSASIRDSELEVQYRNMGMSVDDVNVSITQYMKFQQMSGSGTRQTTEELKSSISAYIDQQDRFSKLTGINAQEQNKANERALSQEQYAAKNAELQARVDNGGPEAEVAKKEMERNRELISFMSANAKGHADNLNKVLSGAINDPGYQQFAQNFPEAIKAIQSGESDSIKIMQLMQQDAKMSAAAHSQLAISGLSDKLYGSYSDTVHLAGVNVEKMAEARDNASKIQIAQKAGLIDDSTKNMSEMNKAQRDVTQDIDSILNTAVPELTSKFGEMSTVLEKLTGVSLSSISNVMGNESGSADYGSSAPAELQSYLKATALIESGGNANAKAGTSSAGGLYQFLDSTWEETVKAMGKHYTLQDKYDPAKAIEVMTYFTNQQKSQLEKSTGTAATSTDLYMAHFLGAGGAGQFINAMRSNPNASAAAIFPKPAAANHAIFYDGQRERSLTEVYKLMGAKVANADHAVAANKWGGKELPSTVALIGTSNQTNKSSLLSGPTDGSVAMLHKIETTSNKSSSAINDTEPDDNDDRGIISELMAMKMERMDRLIKGMEEYMRTSDRLLQLRS